MGSRHAHRWEMEAVGAPLVRRRHEPEAPAPDEVLVEVAGCGVCHTDLGYLYDGVRTNHPLPLTLGHEISGRVVATGSQAKAWSGRSVIVPAVSGADSSSSAATVVVKNLAVIVPSDPADVNEPA